MEIKENISLAPFSNYRIGGPARYFTRVGNLKELREALEFWKEKGAGRPIFILGGGTNILFDDAGFNGLVVQINLEHLYLIGKDVVSAGAGTSMADLVEFCRRNSLAGMEWASGLPGMVGGATRGNAGAFGREMKDSVIQTTSVKIGEPGRVIERNRKTLGFGYRTSFFKKNSGEIILGVRIKLRKGSKKKIEEIGKKNRDYRREYQPLEFPNAGSTFKNVPLTQINADSNADKRGYISVNQRENLRKSALVIKTDPFPVVPAAYLISEAGLKGQRKGGAEISVKHPNFIINRENASSSDVRELIRFAKDAVKEKFGVDLEEEIIFVPTK